MEGIDKILKNHLVLQTEKTEPISDKKLKLVKNNRYSSGRLMKYGGIILFIAEIKLISQSNAKIKFFPPSEFNNFKKTAFFYVEPDENDNTFKEEEISFISFCPEEIDEICRKYWYAGLLKKDGTMAKVIKRQ